VITPGKIERPDPVAVVGRWAALWSTNDTIDAHEVFAPDLRDHRMPPLRDLQGIAREKEFITRIRSAFPDLRVEIEDVVLERDRIAARVMHRGTHHGDFLGFAATGRSVAYEGTVIFRILDGRIAERWGTVDVFGILWQLGVLHALPFEAGLGTVAR
jgi:predicted ester cyclase